MKRNNLIMALSVFVSAFFFILICFPTEARANVDVQEAAEDARVSPAQKGRLAERFAFKANALEWLLTIPNFGVEFDIRDSEYNNMTIGLAAKYNWNTYHKYAPPVVFNLLDIRPEFRYWYRTRKPEAHSKDKKWWDIDRLLIERKNPRTWRAHFIGAYINYANYTFKFSQKGYQGQAVGLGATAGYALPLYDYKKGCIDVEFGFSVGLQLATKDVFRHNPEGYYYSYIERDRNIGFTPFPVISELKVAFVYRTKSIKDKVKTDTEKLRIKSHFDRVKTDYTSALTSITKASYEENLKNVKGESGMKKIMANDSLYVKGLQDMLDAEEKKQVDMIASAFPDEMKNHERQDLRDYVKNLELELETLIGNAKNKARVTFDKDVAKQKAADIRMEKKKAKDTKPEKVKKEKNGAVQ